MEKLERVLLKKKIFAVVFVLLLFSFSAWNVYSEWGAIKTTLKENKFDISKIKNIGGISKAIRKIESGINDNVSFKYNFIEIYGGVQKLLGKSEIDNFSYARDKEGFFYIPNFYQEDINLEKVSASLNTMKTLAKEKGSEFFVFIPPTKYPEESNGEIGMPYQNSLNTMKDYKKMLLKEGYFVVDSTEHIIQPETTLGDVFYKTDHHWTTDAIFKSFVYLVKEMEKKYGIELDKHDFYTNINNYKQEMYENSFLGSAGRQTGMIYGGIDDFNLIYPKFMTNYTMKHPGKEEVVGGFNETAIDINIFKSSNIYDSDLYSVYMDGILNTSYLTNNLNKEGPSMLFVGDSFTPPMAAFLSTVCSQVDVIWCMEDATTYYECIDTKKYDYVVFSAYSTNLVLENPFVFLGNN